MIVANIDRLDAVARRGALAQRSEARRLIAVLSKDPADAEALMASQQLIDAYLNDPYLERN